METWHIEHVSEHTSTPLRLAVISALVILVFGIHSVYATQSTSPKTVCVMQPIDHGVNPKAVSTAFYVLEEHHIKSTYVGLVQELTDKTHKGCDYVVQFAMQNNNREWGHGVYSQALNVPYTISGDVITVYTAVIPVVPNKDEGRHPSVQEACGLHAGTEMFAGFCVKGNPFVPVYKIEKALNEALKTIKL